MKKANLGGTPRRARKFTQSGNVGPICADAGRVYRQAKSFSLVNIDPRVVQLGKAESHRRRNPVGLHGINRPRRSPPVPRTLRRNLKKLLPVFLAPHNFLPASHRELPLLNLMRPSLNKSLRFGRLCGAGLRRGRSVTCPPPIEPTATESRSIRSANPATSQVLIYSTSGLPSTISSQNISQMLLPQNGSVATALS